MSRKAIVLSNGKIDDPTLIRQRLSGWEDAIVIGADAGSLYADQLGLKLNHIVGDFDSLGADALDAYKQQGVEVTLHPPQKDETDLELALLAAVSAGADQIVILGAAGGRFDMTLASVILLNHPALIPTHSEIWVDAQTIWLMRPLGGEIRGTSGDIVSLIPIGGDALGVTTQALAYPLNNETLLFGPPRGVSNVMTDAVARVSLQSGLLVVIYTAGRA